jgi:hypothetical protein
MVIRTLRDYDSGGGDDRGGSAMPVPPQWQQQQQNNGNQPQQQGTFVDLQDGNQPQQSQNPFMNAGQTEGMFWSWNLTEQPKWYEEFGFFIVYYY